MRRDGVFGRVSQPLNRHVRVALVGGLICGAEIITFCNFIEGMRKACNDAQSIMTAVNAVQNDFGAATRYQPAAADNPDVEVII